MSSNTYKSILFIVTIFTTQSATWFLSLKTCFIFVSSYESFRNRKMQSRVSQKLEVQCSAIKSSLFIPTKIKETLLNLRGTTNNKGARFSWNHQICSWRLRTYQSEKEIQTQTIFVRCQCAKRLYIKSESSVLQPKVS